MSVISLSETKPIARTEHDCSCCGRTIHPGEQYENQRNVYDGRAYTYKLCAHCRAATTRALQLCDDWDEGINDGWIDDALFEHHETIADIRLLIGLRRRWTRRDGTIWPIPVLVASEERI